MDKTRCSLCGFTYAESGERLTPSCNCAGAKKDVHITCLQSYLRITEFAICPVCNRRITMVSRGFKSRKEWSAPKLSKLLGITIVLAIVLFCGFIGCLIWILATQCWKLYCIIVVSSLALLSFITIIGCCCASPGRKFWRSTMARNQRWVLVDQSPLTSIRRQTVDNSLRAPSLRNELGIDNRALEKDGLKTLSSLWSSETDGTSNPIFVNYEDDFLPPYTASAEDLTLTSQSNPASLHTSNSTLTSQSNPASLHTSNSNYTSARADNVSENMGLTAIQSASHSSKEKSSRKQRPKSDVVLPSTRAFDFDDDLPPDHAILHRSQTVPATFLRGFSDGGDFGGISRTLRKQRSQKQVTEDDAGLSATLERLKYKIKRFSSEESRKENSMNVMPFTSDVTYRPQLPQDRSSGDFFGSSLPRHRSDEVGLNLRGTKHEEIFLPKALPQSQSDPYLSYSALSGQLSGRPQSHALQPTKALLGNQLGSVYKGSVILSSQSVAITPEPKTATMQREPDNRGSAEQRFTALFSDPRMKKERPSVADLFFSPDSDV